MPTNEGQEQLPSQFGRYTLTERLAIGGMAEVFKAKIQSSHGFEKTIVIKRILPHLAADKTFVSMFIDEAKLTAQLTHPKIVQLLDFGDVNGQFFIALEFVDGFDALALLRGCAGKRLRMPMHLAIFLIMEVLDALDYAHNARDMEGRPMRIVHRDISPSNIFIFRRGDVKLGDFGIAHAQERESKTQAGTLKGKYGYMSPEQVVGAPLDGRSDLFAMGIVFAEMLMGRRLFTAKNDLDVLLMVRDGKLERLEKYCSDLPPELDAILRKSLAKGLADRYQSAAEFRDALGDFLFQLGRRVGAADLRAFTTDLFDPDPAARERLMVHYKQLPSARPAATRLPQVNEQRAVPGAADVSADISGGLHPSRLFTPPPVEPPAARVGAAGKREMVIDAEPAGTPPLAAEPAPAAPAGLAHGASVVMAGQHGGAALPLLDDALNQPLSVIDLDQWGQEPSDVSSRQIGWTPVSNAEQGRQQGQQAQQGQPFSSYSGVNRRSAPVLGAEASMRTSEPSIRGEGSMRRSSIGQFTSGAPQRPPDSAGDLAIISPMRIFSDLALAAETGLLQFSLASHVKEVYLVGGAPESVNSSLRTDRFGEYLVSRGVLRPADLERALGMLPQFSGKLGDTLVGLGIMKPLDVFRLLSQQVRDRVIEIFGWTQGNYAFWRGITNPQEAFPLGLDTFEILGAGVLTLTQEVLVQRLHPFYDARPASNPQPRVSPDAFRLGPTPAEVCSLLDGSRTLAEWLGTFGSGDEQLTFMRALYLLIETDLAQFQ